jgi:protein tyrosine phosphatase
MKQIPQNQWLYFHCKGGKGRTTTFMAMVDMIHNAKQHSFEEILIRQQKLGGQNLLNLNPAKPLNNYAAERLEFLNSFYQYCQQNNVGKTSWKVWVRKEAGKQL